MKITVIQKASTVRKPQNFCPWVSDEAGPRSEKKIGVTRRVARQVRRRLRRRIACKGGCGVFLLPCCYPACGPPKPEAPVDAQQTLTIGYPGGSWRQGQDFWCQPNRRRASTLEGLTQVAIDGRTVRRLATKWEWSRGRTEPERDAATRRDASRRTPPQTPRRLAEILRAIVANQKTTMISSRRWRTSRRSRPTAISGSS